MPTTSSDTTITPQLETLLEQLRTWIEDPAVVETIVDHIGPLADVYVTPWEELSPLQKKIRKAASEADRAEHPIRSMADIYELLINATNTSGARLHLGPGCTIIALDKTRRRYLIPSVSGEVLDQVLAAPSKKVASMILKSPGTVRYHWSTDRTGLVPDPQDLTKNLPLPVGGTYIVAHRNPVALLNKTKWQEAIVQLGKQHPIADVVIWDPDDNATLWSLRGGFGLSVGKDVEFHPDIKPAAVKIKNALWPENV